MTEEDQLEEDQLEAQSYRYTDSARALRLSSGRWAVWTGGLQGQSLRIVEEPGLAQALVAAQEGNSRLYEMELEAESDYHSGKVGRAQQAMKTAEDMDL